jgi:segregation and condensation protein A
LAHDDHKLNPAPAPAVSEDVTIEVAAEATPREQGPEVALEATLKFSDDYIAGVEDGGDTQITLPAPSAVLTERAAAAADRAAAVADPASLVSVVRSGGIEILVSMAEKGEIDPKNIDIIDICDRFLRAIAAAPKENLRQSGKIIFHASVLLRMKAEQLLIDKIEDLDIGGDDFIDFEDDGSLIYDSNNQPVARQITLADLERALTRRTKNSQTRRRRVTLEQLIEALRDAERYEKEKAQRKPKAVIDMEGYADMKGMEDILELAHDEDIEEVIARIEQILLGYFESGDILSLVALIEKLGGRGDWVDAFLAVLFLSNAGKVLLQQDKFYGPLFIARTEMEATA